MRSLLACLPIQAALVCLMGSGERQHQLLHCSMIGKDSPEVGHTPDHGHFLCAWHFCGASLTQWGVNVLEAGYMIWIVASQQPSWFSPDLQQQLLLLVIKLTSHQYT